MSHEKIDANEEIDVECDVCGGEGSWESDEFSHKSGHYTKSHKCATCDGSGLESMTRYASLERDYEAEGRENVRLSRELTVAHERIVALTKQLQDLRSGGGTGAATPVVPVGTQGMAPTLPDGFDGANPDGVGITLGV